MRYTIALFFAILVGLSLGLIGGGGSILAVPILKYIVGVSAKEAIAMSLFIVGTVSIVGLIPHWQEKNVNLAVALSFIPPAMMGAFLGAKITSLPVITDTVQIVSFAVIMLLASILMLKKSSKKTNNHQEENPEIIAEEKSKKNNLVRKIILTTLQGLGVGILTGFVGVGGGFLIIPCLVLVGGIPMKEAVGTSLLIIATNSASGFLGYLNQVELNWIIMISFSVFASLGIIMGAKLGQKIEAKYLQKAFGYFVLVVSVFVLIAR